MMRAGGDMTDAAHTAPDFDPQRLYWADPPQPHIRWDFQEQFTNDADRVRMPQMDSMLDSWVEVYNAGPDPKPSLLRRVLIVAGNVAYALPSGFLVGLLIVLWVNTYPFILATIVLAAIMALVWLLALGHVVYMGYVEQAIDQLERK